MARRDKEFWESKLQNNRTFIHYYDILMSYAISLFEWSNLPETVDERFLELTLYADGKAVFFKDPVLGHLALQTMIGGKLDVYRIPNDRTAFATNGYNNRLTADDSVIIFNNRIHTNTMTGIEFYAKKLAEIDRIIDINAKAQKTPILITCDEHERLTMLNLYKKYEGNEPFIFGDKNLNTQGITCIKTDAPYLCDRLHDLRNDYWNEAMTFLGIINAPIQKRERLIASESASSQGSIYAMRYSRLEARKDACDKINKMFGLNIDVDYRPDFRADDINVMAVADEEIGGGFQKQNNGKQVWKS